MAATKGKIEWKEWADWQRVLTAWRRMGRTGLTLHALATLCERSPQELLPELLEKRAYVQYCGIVLAPVWSWYKYPHYRWEYTYDGPRRRTLVWAESGWRQVDPTRDEVYQLAEAQIVRWPWPQYKSVAKGVGETAITRITPKQLALLRKVIKGAVSPWGARSPAVV